MIRRFIMLRMLAVLTALALPSSAFASFDHDYKEWDALLQKVVTLKGPIGTVHYQAMKADPSKLNAFTDAVQAVTEAEYQSWTEKQRLAFLINAYNALTFKLIVDHYPVKSIKDLGSVFSSPWKKKFFKLFGKEQHLDGIEHETIRKQFPEARIHFAVVCASKGCPTISNRAWLAGKLDEQFENAARLFLSDTQRNRYDAAKKELQISNIFKWYKEDFVKYTNGVKAFVASRITTDPAVQKQILSDEVDVEHTDYDWSLNETK
jgi:Protein of unknown function, DUF547